MIEHFQVSAKTDGGTVCKIWVEPISRSANVRVTVAGRITVLSDGEGLRLHTVTNNEWSDFSYWERKASDIAKAHSPFWRGETAA